MSGEVAVVGGGLAGLVAARHLEAEGVSVRLFEAKETVGGRVRSVHEDGYVFDRGFQVLFRGYPAAQRELDYDELELEEIPSGAVVCRPNHRSVIADPLRNPRAALRTLLSPEMTLKDGIRTLKLRSELADASPAEWFGGSETTIRECLEAHGFSERAIEGFFEPFYGGITLDRSLSTASSVFEFTFGMLARAPAVLPADGMGRVADQLAAKARDAGVEIRTDERVTAIEREAGSASLETETDHRHHVDAVLVATDPLAARSLTGVESIPSDGLGCVTQYTRLPGGDGLGTGGRLLLNADGDDPNQILELSAVSEQYAPGQETLLSATFLGEPAATDSELCERTTAVLRSWYPERRIPELQRLRTDRIPFAQFSQPPGFSEGRPAVDAPDGHVFLAGEYMQNSSINGALDSGRLGAAAVLEDLD